MFKPYHSGNSHSMYSRQKYYFPMGDAESIEGWNRVIEILCEDLEFHEYLATQQATVMLDPDGKIHFKNTGPKITGARYSKMMKGLWDRFKPVLSDYGISLKNKYTGELVK